MLESFTRWFLKYEIDFVIPNVQLAIIFILKSIFKREMKKRNLEFGEVVKTFQNYHLTKNR